MKQICPDESCTGCGLCMVRCPKKCISMEEGELGHLYPYINQVECIDCGLCKKGCPSLHDMRCKYPSKAFAAWSVDNDDYISSTSGGAASVFTNYFLSNGGVVYGCAVLPNIKIKHIRVDDLQDAYKLKGSKYVQSSIVDVLPQIKQDVKLDRKVLFIGTPCQVAAVKQMYNKQPENLYLVDIICHGVPSNKWLSDYITKNLGIDGSKVSMIKFRLPDAFSLSVYDKNELLYKSDNLWTHRYEDLYYNTFMDGFTYRKSCFECHYAKPQRISDITIGDFWGLGKEMNDKYIPEHNYGISCILPITDKGTFLISAVQDKFNLFERPVTESINGNDQLRHPKKMDWRIRCFRKLCKYMSICFSYKMLMLDKILKYKVKKLIKQ